MALALHPSSVLVRSVGLCSGSCSPAECCPGPGETLAMILGRLKVFSSSATWKSIAATPQGTESLRCPQALTQTAALLCVHTALHGGFLGSPSCTPRGEHVRPGCVKMRLLADMAEVAACQLHGPDAPLEKASKPWDMSFWPTLVFGQ